MVKEYTSKGSAHFDVSVRDHCYKKTLNYAGILYGSNLEPIPSQYCYEPSFSVFQQHLNDLSKTLYYIFHLTKISQCTRDIVIGYFISINVLH